MSMTNHKASRFLLTSLRISVQSPRTGAYSLPPGGTAAEIMTLKLASLATGAHLHLQRSLCLAGDADKDKDGAMNFLPRVDWVRERSSLSREQEECLLRSEFIKDSSNMDELRVSSLL